MDLNGTQLVVLSACQTGQGDIQRGQGVYGLRRAIFLAGAETLVISLWQVSDRVTKDLMGAYYEGLARGGGRAEALRQAALRVYAQHPHPYYWSSFIVLGEEGALQNLPE